MIRLEPLQATDIESVAGWLSDKGTYQWLDFNGLPQPLRPAHLKIMAQKKNECLRVFVKDEEPCPIGIVALSNINHRFKTGMLWYALGNKSLTGKGYTSAAVAALLQLGFGELGLNAINAWVVETNGASVTVLERNGFKFIGRQRHCHCIDGHPHDRLLYDLLKEECPQSHE